MHDLFSDVKYATRLFVQTPGFTAVALLALALGIGANTAIFSVVDAVLLRPLPCHDPGRLVVVSEQWKQKLPVSSTSPLNFIDWQEGNRSFEEMAALFQLPMNLNGGDEPRQVMALSVSADFFPMLGVRPALGRWFRPEEDRPSILEGKRMFLGARSRSTTLRITWLA